MEYIYKNDLMYFIKNEKKLIFTYIIFMIAYFVLNLIRFNTTKDIISIETLALDCKFDLNDWLNLIAFIIYISIHCYIGLKLFTKDFKNNPSNIFLRMSYKKWILYKILCISTISILILICSYIVTMILHFSLVNGSFVIDIHLFIKNYIFILILQQLILILYTMFSSHNFIILLVIFAIIIKMFNVQTSIINMNMYILLIIYALIFVSILLVNKKLYVNLFESEE